MLEYLKRNLAYGELGHCLLQGQHHGGSIELAMIDQLPARCLLLLTGLLRWHMRLLRQDEETSLYEVQWHSSKKTRKSQAYSGGCQRSLGSYMLVLMRYVDFLHLGQIQRMLMAVIALEQDLRGIL